MLYGQLPALRQAVGNVTPGPATALSLAASDTPVHYGELMTLSGALTTGGTGVANATVVVQKRSPSGRWVAMTQTTTGADGAWATTIPLRAASPVRATANGATSSSVVPPLDPGLTLRQPTRYPRTGRDLTVRGTARGVSEVTIVLRRKQGGRYITAARRTAKVKNGRFTGSVPVRRSALHAVSVEVKEGTRTFRSSSRGVRSRG
jgi:hypothetical protein